jgi:integrating conjugative element protein (TIGR03761 family)
MKAEPIIVESCTDADAKGVIAPSPPGALRGEIWIALQTHQALILVHGRGPLPDKPAIIGLIGFADRLRVIEAGARNDNPYADWWLIKIDAAIRSANDFIEAQEAAVSNQLVQLSSMEIAVASSECPTRIRLRFASPYAYQAARLLGRYDRLVCAVLTAAHVGLLDIERRQQIQHSCARKLRSLFMLPQAYKSLNLSRATVRTQAGRAHEAVKAMGEIPEDILNGEHRAAFAPRCSIISGAMSRPASFPALPPSMPALHGKKNVDV